jgi:2-oxo-4-hydroxy-4-carboxy-5-ureidoimidazoline decarboxylase
MTISAINTMDCASVTAALGHLFEHSPWVAEETWARRPFRDAVHLYSELCATLQLASADRQMALIQAHPDLAGRLARQNQLTQDSAREQTSAGLTLLSDNELAEFQKLNDAYRAKFGFPFIICARLNAKQAILDAMRNRQHHDVTTERTAALAEIEKIAWLRLQDVMSDSND